MKLGKVITLREYKEERQMRAGAAQKSAPTKALPDAAHLWELMDRNISIEFWKKGM